MAVYEKNTLLTCRDADGNKYLLYPITTLECVDGAEDLLHYGAAQELTDDEQAQARENIGAAKNTDLTDLATQVEGLSGITYIESSTDAMVNVRDLESGTYVFKGKFSPFSGATSVMSFSSRLLVNIVKGSSYSSMMVFYPVNNCVQYLKITDESSEKKYVYLNSLMDAVDALETSVGTLTALATTDQSSLVAAVNELVTRVTTLETAAGGE